MRGEVLVQRVLGACAFMACCWPRVLGQSSRIHVGDMPDEVAVVMAAQMDAWNQGDLEGFMEGYWRSDSLLFVGKSGSHARAFRDAGTLQVGLSHAIRHGHIDVSQRQVGARVTPLRLARRRMAP